MLFKRRNEAGLWERFRLSLWPRVSWKRSGTYLLKRTLRLSGSPYAIAMGTALGCFVSCTPFLGLHIAITLALAWLVGGNLIAGAMGTMLGNPATYPFLWAGSYELGQLMLGRAGQHAPARLEHDLLSKSWSQLWPLIEPMTLGSIPLGLAAGSVAYLVIYKAVATYQKTRREHLATRRLASSRRGDSLNEAEPLAALKGESSP